MKKTTKRNRIITLAVCTIISLPLGWSSAQSMNKNIQEKGLSAISSPAQHVLGSMNTHASVNQANSVTYLLIATGGYTYSSGWGKAIDSTTYTYNTNSTIATKTDIAWSATYGIWYTKYKHIYTYDANKNMLTDQEKFANALVDTMKFTYTYDVNNNKTSELGQSWTSSTSQWKNQYKYTNTYDVNNNITSQVHQTWNGSAWVTISRYTYTYDVNKNLTLQKYQTGNGSTWTDAEQYAFTYDGNNNLITDTDQSWDSNTSTWVNYGKYTYTYDGSNNQTSVIVQSGNGSPWVNDMEETYAYDVNKNMTASILLTWSGSAWVNSYKTIYYYTTAAGIKETAPSTEQFSLYPNPVVNELNIVPTKQTASSSAKNKIEIMNVLGQSMYNAAFNEKSVVDMKSFPSGIYFVRFSSDNAIITTKRVVKE
ncbi:MAG: T9SS type A sorting domain-containing protein [Bacteroidetes bacterium]|nr:T9SS type A sorting domain-containing protein [Bacteroidota bacterium]